ncbi:hypothetical protein PoB_007112500 [Plakobranchus ocellatus]|uniref:Uncharacterized protein n=1 Tax=Plakobranchus ocellatus TaxID=259542 RepID=A0AAV4DKF2_9GAST|nr:hypothetical protein PoB_007112500 [Plakobranchus ocellatus]
MPEVEEVDDACADSSGRFIITDNGFGPHQESDIPNSTTYFYNVTVAAIGATSINSTVLNTTLASPTTASVLETILHNLTTSVLSTPLNLKIYPKETTVSPAVTVNSAAKSISSTYEQLESSTSSLALARNSVLFSSTTVTNNSHNLLNTSSKDLGLASSITTSLEYLLQNVPNVTADFHLTLEEVNSTNFDLHDSLSTSNRVHGSHAVPDDTVTEVLNEKTDNIRMVSHDALNPVKDKIDSKSIESDVLSILPTPNNISSSMGALASLYLNLTTSYASIPDHGFTSIGYDSALINLSETVSDTLECRKDFILLRTGLQRTEVRFFAKSLFETSFVRNFVGTIMIVSPSFC